MSVPRSHPTTFDIAVPFSNSLSPDNSTVNINIFNTQKIKYYCVHVYRFSVGPPVRLVCSRHSCPFSTASEVKSFVSSPFPLPVPTLLQFLILLGSLLSSLRTTCPYHLNTVFSILSKLVCVTPIFFLINSYSVSPCSSSPKTLFCP